MWILDFQQKTVVQHCDGGQYSIKDLETDKTFALFPIVQEEDQAKQKQRATIASNAPEFMNLLIRVVDCQRKNYGNATMTHVELVPLVREIEAFFESNLDLKI